MVGIDIVTHPDIGSVTPAEAARQFATPFTTAAMALGLTAVVAELCYLCGYRAAKGLT